MAVKSFVVYFGSENWVITPSTATTAARAEGLGVVALVGHGGDRAVAVQGHLDRVEDGAHPLVPGEIWDHLVEVNFHAPRMAWEEIVEEFGLF